MAVELKKSEPSTQRGKNLLANLGLFFLSAFLSLLGTLVVFEGYYHVKEGPFLATNFVDPNTEFDPHLGWVKFRIVATGMSGAQLPRTRMVFVLLRLIPRKNLSSFWEIRLLGDMA